MKVSVFGGTGLTGRLFIEQALDAGWELTTLVRTPEKLSHLKDKITIIDGALDDKEKVYQAVSGQDAVVSTLGSKQPNPGSLLTDATKLIVAAMKEAGVSRIVAVTSLGCRESLQLIKNPRFLDMINGPFRPNWDDKSGQEEIIENSGLDYTIARPGGLTDEPATGKYSPNGQFDPVPFDRMLIPRADVAQFLVKAIEDDTTSGKIVSLYTN